jgi:single-strand DNA-binding protein
VAGRGVNKAILIGNLGADPELRQTQGGQNVATFRIATSDRWKDRGGQVQERTEWHNIVAWGQLADIVQQYLTKGSQVYIEGRIQTRQWEDRDGQKRYTTEIVANQMVMLGGRGDGAVAGRQAARQTGRAEAAAATGRDDTFNDFPESPEEVDDDLPF